MLVSLCLDENKSGSGGGGGSDTNVAGGPSQESTLCGGEWKVPRNCNPENNTCEYSAKWEYLPRKDEIRFTITTTNTDTWTGVAFSKDDKMVRETPNYRNNVNIITYKYFTINALINFFFWFLPLPKIGNYHNLDCCKPFSKVVQSQDFPLTSISFIPYFFLL